MRFLGENIKLRFVMAKVKKVTRLPKEMAQWLEKKAVETDLSESAILWEALTQYRKRNK